MAHVHQERTVPLGDRRLPELEELGGSIHTEKTVSLRKSPPAPEVQQPQPQPQPAVAPTSPRASRGPTLGQLVDLSIVSVGVVLAVAAAGIAVWGLPYYVLNPVARVDHPLHSLFKPGGLVGLWTGVVGSALMVAMLSYSIRKLLLGWTWLGSVTHWFRFHVMCGILGPIYILLHTSFKLPVGYIAVGFWCMVLVALSGAFGRYVYGHFPRTAQGRSQQVVDGLENLAALRAELVAATPDARPEDVGQALALVRDMDAKPRSVFGWLVLHIDTHRRAGLVEALLARSGLSTEQRHRASEGLMNQLRATRNLAGWDVSAQLFKWWHLFHEPLAKAMYLLALVHILEAILIGGALLHLFGAG